MERKKLDCGRKNAWKILSKMGKKFRRKTAIRKLTEAGCINPEKKFEFLLKKGFIEKIANDCFQTK